MLLKKKPTGVKHDAEKPMLALIPQNAELQVGAVMTYGAKKYGEHNYLGGISYLRLASASRRHLNAFLQGEDLDRESGLPHLAHAAASIMMLIEMTVEHPEMDNRFASKKGGKRE